MAITKVNHLIHLRRITKNDNNINRIILYYFRYYFMSRDEVSTKPICRIVSRDVSLLNLAVGIL